jgi:acyl carrier protein
MNIKENVEAYLLGDIAVGREKKSLTSDEDLLEQGIIDSLGIMKLILHLEKAFGIKVNDDDVVPENFQNLNSIVSFIERKAEGK